MFVFVFRTRSATQTARSSLAQGKESLHKESFILVVCAPYLCPFFFHGVRCTRYTPGHTWTSYARRRLVWNHRSSQSPHVRVENLFHEFSVQCKLAQRQCVDACEDLRVVCSSPFEHHRDCVFSDDGMGVGGNTFGFRAVTRSKKLIWKNGNRWTTNKAMSR